jgi:hypothetical protein
MRMTEAAADEPVPEEEPVRPVRGPRWAHRMIGSRRRHERAERSGEPEAAIDSSNLGSDLRGDGGERSDTGRDPDGQRDTPS